MPSFAVSVRDAALEISAATISSVVQQILQKLAAIDATLQQLVAAPSVGMFNPPAGLVKSVPMEVTVSVLELEVGQTATGTLSFSETTPPQDGAVVSDSPAVTITLDADLITWHCHGVSVTTAAANCTYTGTSAPPDVGPAQVAPMVVTVVPVPVAETGDFNPQGATITGP